jgi:hypothetical protein
LTSATLFILYYEIFIPLLMILAALKLLANRHAGVEYKEREPDPLQNIAFIEQAAHFVNALASA